VQVNVQTQVLTPDVQHQAESRFAPIHPHPLGVGGKLGQRLRHAGKQGVDEWFGVLVVQGVELVRQCKLVAGALVDALHVLAAQGLAAAP
jgi:hypothetical protein